MVIARRDTTYEPENLIGEIYQSGIDPRLKARRRFLSRAHRMEISPIRFFWFVGRYRAARSHRRCSEMTTARILVGATSIPAKLTLEFFPAWSESLSHELCDQGRDFVAILLKARGAVKTVPSAV